jgi:hypothetical protein
VNSQHFAAVETGNNRAEYRYVHSGTPHLSTAFDLKEKAEILLNIPRSLGTVSAVFEIFDESLKFKLTESVGEWIGMSREFDEYLFEIPTESIGTGLYFIRPRLSVYGGYLYGHKWAGSLYFDLDGSLTNMMQLT